MDSQGRAVVSFTILSSVVLLVVIIFNGLASIPAQDWNLFRNTTGDISAKYETDLTPAGYTFTIWAVIYTWQLAWVVYSLTTICRRNIKGRIILNPIVLPILFHVFWIASCIFNITWLFVWDREYLMTSFVILLLFTLTGYAACAFQAIATEENKLEMRKYNSKAELTLIYILVQNGTDLIFSWTTVATMLNLSIALTYADGGSMSRQDASTLSLCLLLVLVIGWSVVENTVFFKYFHFVYSWYGVLIWAGIGILVKNYDMNNPNTALTLTIIAVALVCLCVKIIVYFKRRHTLKSHNLSKVGDISMAVTA